MLDAPIGKQAIGVLVGSALLVVCAVAVSWRLAAPPAPVAVPTAGPSSALSGPPPRVPAPTVAKRPPAASVPAAPTAAAASGLERKAFRLEMENAQLRRRLDDMLNWILANVRGTYPLPESQMANLKIDPVDKDMAVSADLAQLLRLNEKEIERLDTAFLGTRSVLQELGSENIAVQQPADNQLVLNIPPYPEQGQAVRDELYEELKKTLGPARFDRFLQVAEPALEARLDYFGQADRTVEFETVQDAASGDSQLFVRDERVVPSKADPLRQDIVAFEQIVTELPEEYYAYWNWLPDYVTRFARSN